MKRLWTVVLALLLLTALLTGCAAKQRDVYYGGVKLKWVDQPYAPEEISLDNEWLQRKALEAADGLDFTTPEGFLAYLEAVEPMLKRFFMNEEYYVTNILHFSNGIWGVRYVYAPSGDLPYYVLDGGDAYFYFSEEDGEVYDYVRDLYGENLWSAFVTD